MQITDVKIRKSFDKGKLKAVVSITIDNMFAVHDIKIIQNDNHIFMAMPSRKDENGMFRDIIHPISSEARNIIESVVLNAYEKHKILTDIE